MLKDVTRIIAIVCVFSVLSDFAVAQRGGGGGPRGRAGGQGGLGGGGNASTGGGGMCSRMSGSASSGNQGNAITGNFFANSAGGSNLMTPMAGMRQQRGQRLQNNAVAAGANRNRPTADQFVRAASRFDADSDGELNETELTEVATAVINELRSRQHASPPRASGNRSVVAGNQGRPANAIPPNASMEKLTNAFVSKALSYDRDNSATLNAAETRALATAFIRSLS
ncbi:hypothetical protein [Fuerstiella marisgermanici]|uniref:EF-hand domain-containing protein n=1 Tax=Fuerstiella marisgermanici TaxID=1891926 RepID=A0A1P8W9N3_9PLAN|nr:hypothetical protein [Fuerstiella marisgermanici]APZ90768.1 hypothetical protein Fuma_00352 [Fuerstiella marisgermanici]